MSWDPEEWVTTKEAVAILGYQESSVTRLCQSGKIEAIRWALTVNRTRWLLRREQVEELAEERQLKREMKTQGLKFCSGCGEWKKAASEFWKGQFRCIPCMKAQVSSPHKGGRGRSPWKGFAGPFPGEVKEYVGIRKRAKPEDSLKYACMDVGFSHKGIPPGLTKRQAYCSWCSAPRCVHHPEMTPEMIRTSAGVPTRYPPYDVHWAIFGDLVVSEEIELELSPAGMTAESGG